MATETTQRDYFQISKWTPFALSASLRSFGNRIGSIFERKKKETAEVAEEQKENTEDLVEQQLTKASEILRNTQAETEDAAKATGAIYTQNFLCVVEGFSQIIIF